MSRVARRLVRRVERRVERRLVRRVVRRVVRRLARRVARRVVRRVVSQSQQNLIRHQARQINQAHKKVRSHRLHVPEPTASPAARKAAPVAVAAVSQGQAAEKAPGKVEAKGSPVRRAGKTKPSLAEVRSLGMGPRIWVIQPKVAVRHQAKKGPAKWLLKRTDRSQPMAVMGNNLAVARLRGRLTSLIRLANLQPQAVRMHRGAAALPVGMAPRHPLAHRLQERFPRKKPNGENRIFLTREMPRTSLWNTCERLLTPIAMMCSLNSAGPQSRRERF
ncbi:MAG: hypothetical protein DWI23_02990 [Planctomycetota bacterium]|nr:MAG: hypothetical protein DWI23_02990 [Planctomycetota bacterium]